MRAALALIACAVVLGACTSPVPTNSPDASPSPTSTDQPTAPATPTVGPTTDTGLPTSILGLPVHTVAGMHQLAADGKLDGRFAAVAGYWRRSFLPCPYVAHLAILDGFCSGAQFADDLADVSESGGDINSTGLPLAVPETVARDNLNSGDPVAVVLIIHGADGRAAQCKKVMRAECEHRLVIDRVAWINGQEVSTLLPDTSEIEGQDLHTTADEAVAAGLQSGETPVLLKPMHATQLNDVDPRFVGTATGIVWYLRVISGVPDREGISPGRDLLVDDATGTVLADLPVAVDGSYQSGRLTLDTNDRGDGSTLPALFSIKLDDRLIADGQLGSSSAPFALQPGEYVLHASVPSGAILASPIPAGKCSVSISVAAGDDVSYYADWPSPINDCRWKEGTLFPT